MVDRMSRRLLLLRHAKSAWDRPLPDIERPLAERGRRAARLIGDWLAERGDPIDATLCSPAERTRQTWDLVRARLPDPPAANTVPEIYEGDREALLGVLAGVPDDRYCVLLIGHNPGLDSLLRWLVPEEPATTAKGKLMTTGAVAVLACPQRWDRLAASGAELEVLMRPKSLESKKTKR